MLDLKIMNYSNSFGCYTVGKVRHRLFCMVGIKATKCSWDLSNLGQVPGEIAMSLAKSLDQVVEEGPVVWSSPLYS